MVESLGLGRRRQQVWELKGALPKTLHASTKKNLAKTARASKKGPTCHVSYDLSSLKSYRELRGIFEVQTVAHIGYQLSVRELLDV